MKLRIANILDPVTEHKIAPLLRESRPSQPTFVAIHGSAGSRKPLAEKILSKLGRPVLRVDSKYIGETEKNLSQVLDAAARTGAVLFFDEADALFGKRSAVKSAQDRYANLETNYLLEMAGTRGIIAVLVGLHLKKPPTVGSIRYRWIDIP